MNWKAPAYWGWPSLFSLLYCGTVGIWKCTPMDGMGRADCISFYSFLAWCQYTKEGMVWILLTFPLPLQTECCSWGSAERFCTLNESLGQILWPSFSLKTKPANHRNYFTWDFYCYFRSTSSRGYPLWTPGTSDPSGGKSRHRASRFIFGYPQNSAWKSDSNILRKYSGQK